MEVSRFILHFNKEISGYCDGAWILVTHLLYSSWQLPPQEVRKQDGEIIDRDVGTNLKNPFTPFAVRLPHLDPPPGEL